MQPDEQPVEGQQAPVEAPAESAVLPVGSQEVEVSSEFSPEQLDFLAQQEVGLGAVKYLLGLTNSKMTLEAAVGGVKDFEKALAEGKQPADPRAL